MRTLLGMLVLVAAIGCGKGGGDDHWSKRPLETQSGTVSGVDFTIQVPKGMRMNARGDEVEFDLHEKGRTYTPDLNIRSWPHKSTLDQYVESQQNQTFVRKEQVGDAFVVSQENDAYPGKQDFLVHVEKSFGETSLSCDARVTPFRPGDKVKETMLPLVEAMCLSIELK
jgi:hypothetical protein